MDKQDVIRTLEEMGDLLELDGGSAWFAALPSQQRDVFVDRKHEAATSPEANLGRWLAPAAARRRVAGSATVRRAPAKRKRKA